VFIDPKDIVWYKIAPLKVCLLAKRLLYNMLPTKDNLVRCGVLYLDSILCVGGCGGSINLR
jgi:hypothetical protein